MSNDTHQIAYVRPGSLADQAGIGTGDTILKAGGKELKDIFDYYYYE